MYTFKASNSFCPYIIWFSVAKVIKCDLYLNYKQSFWKLLHCIPWHQFDSAFDPLGNQPKVVYWDYIFYFFNNFHSSLFVQLSYSNENKISLCPHSHRENPVFIKGNPRFYPVLYEILSCSVSKETIDLTVTRGRLWSNNSFKSANSIILCRTKASLW